MTGAELLVKLKENFDTDDIGNEDFPALVTDLKKTKGIDLGEVEIAEEFGGGEGDGEYCYFVFYFKTFNIYIKIEGFYSSYSGSEYENDPFIVTPVIKPVTIFEAI